LTTIVPPVPVSSEASRAAAGTAALAALQTLGRVLALLFVVIATREVLPAQFGRYSIVAGLVAFAGFVADFGSTTVITRLVSRDPASSDELIRQTLLGSVVVGMVAYVAVVGYVAVGPYPHDLTVDAVIGGLAIPIDAALTSILAALDGHGLITRRAVVTFVRLAVVAGAGTVAIVVTGEVRLAIAAIALGPFVGLVLATVFARRYSVWRLALRPRWAGSVALFKMAVPYAMLGGIGAIVARLDLLVLSWFANTTLVAQYDLALRGIEAATGLGTVIGGPALFILSKRLGIHDIEGARRAYAHAVRVAYLIGIPMSVVLVALHAPLTRIVFGPQYTASGPLLAVLGLSVWLAILGWAQGAVVLAGGSTTRALRASLVLLVTAGVLDLALIPTFDAMGAAVATVGAAVIACAVFDFLNRETMGVATPRPSLALVASSLVAGLLMAGASAVGPGWLGLVALPVLPLLLWVTGVVTAHDVRRLSRLVVEGSRA
jgi:O-antigen/teichoic acid export membrane protein